MSTRTTSLSRTSLSGHAGALRLSLLVSLGFLSQACGGSASMISDGGGGADPQNGGGATNGGASNGGATNGGASNGGATNGGASNGGAQGGTRECQSPSVDPVTGLVKCVNGFSHRAQASQCSAPVEAAGGAADDQPPSDAGAASFCTTDAECSTLHFGYCASGFGQAPHCAAGCQNDSDCASGVCICDGKTPGRCQPSNCKIDADCGANSLCASAMQICGEPGFQCLSDQDECLTNADCPGSACVIQQSRRVCLGAVCGRPFLVAEAPRLADVAERRDWLDLSISADCTGLSALERAELAAHWSRLGQMEHASIAAFARFNLQLLSLGAPAELVEACNRALVDETAHTRLCFALASQYGGTRVGPGKLEIADCFENSSLPAVLKLVLSEGCIGETVAALEALEAAELATDPGVARVLRRIARDEQRHAELAFGFVRWALEQSSLQAQTEFALEAEQRLAEFESVTARRAPEPQHAGLAAHGVVAGEQLREVHLRAAREVVRPLLDGILAGSASTQLLIS